jgi:hypothetical protein
VLAFRRYPPGQPETGTLTTALRFAAALPPSPAVSARVVAIATSR